MATARYSRYSTSGFDSLYGFCSESACARWRHPGGANLPARLGGQHFRNDKSRRGIWISRRRAPLFELTPQSLAHKTKPRGRLIPRAVSRFKAAYHSREGYMPLFSRAILYRLRGRRVLRRQAPRTMECGVGKESENSPRVLFHLRMLRRPISDGISSAMNSNGNVFGASGQVARAVTGRFMKSSAGREKRAGRSACSTISANVPKSWRRGKVVVDASGNIYGAAAGEGGSAEKASYSRLTPNATRKHWTLHVLHDFCVAETGCPDAPNPMQIDLCRCSGRASL